MRRLPWLLLLAAPLARGQGVDLRPALDVLQRERVIPAPPGTPRHQDPLEPQGHPQLPAKDPRLPPPLPEGEASRRLRILRGGDNFTQVGSRVLATGGGLHIQYRGYDIYADEVEGNTATNVFTLTGNVQLIGEEAIVKGQRVIVDFENETFRAEDSEAQLRPSFLQGRVLDDVYLQGATAFGTEREVFAEHGYLTTCNLDHPHFHIHADHSTVRPGRRAILRRVRLSVLNRTILTIPYLVVPLEETSERYIPEVGQSPDEGYYVKSRIGIPLRGDNLLDTRLDYMTKLGGGLGADYRYLSRGAMQGLLSVYGITGGPRTFNVLNRHEQRLGSAILQVDSNYQRNSYLNAPASALLTTRATLNLPQGRDNSRLTYNRSSNESSGFRYLNETLGLDDTRSIFRFRTNLNVSWVSSASRFTGGNPIEREQVDVRFRGQRDLQRAVAELEYSRSIPVGTIANFFSPSDRTPVFALRSDAGRLMGTEFARNWPFQAELSIGEYIDARRRDQVTRSNFDLNWQRPDPGDKRFNASFNGRFRQGFYSDDTAQYVVGFGSNARYRLGEDTAFNLRYSYLRPEGFSPLALDRIGKTHFASADVSVRPFRTLLVGAQTGYDLLEDRNLQTRWQTVGVRTEFTPTEFINLRTLSTYDPFLHAWSNVRLDFVGRFGGTFVSAGARYDGLRNTWGQANLFIDGLTWGRLKMSTVLAYNGYIKKFEARHFSFTYDLHCAEAILQIIDNPVGFRSGREINFFIRLKALPFDTPFGIGRRGQGFGTGTGRDF